MTKADFLKKLETILEADPGSLSGTEPLRELEGWDSLAVMSTLAMLDKHFGVKVPAERIYACKTADELAALAGDRLAG
jgi:acyl carrier protein